MPDDTDWGLVPDSDLREMAQGCTELTCLYHGQINAELRRRSRLNRPAEPGTCRYGTHAPRDCPARVYALGGTKPPACPVPSTTEEASHE